MTTTNLSPVLSELERMYDRAIEHFWLEPGRQLTLRSTVPRPVVNISSRGRKLYVNSWYTSTVWADTTEQALAALAGEDMLTIPEVVKRAEIVVASEVLADPIQAVAELVRQMVTHHCLQPDARPGENHYYSKHWRDHYAGRVDCEASINPEQPSRGFSVWTPQPKFRLWVLETLDFAPFSVERASAEAVRKGSRNKKWQCGHMPARAAFRLNAVCLECAPRHVTEYLQRTLTKQEAQKAYFQWAEKDEPNPYADEKGA